MDKYLGKRLDGRYEMRELIGVGGMAYVYKAYDAVDDRIVAVKILRDEFLNSEEFVRRFRNESKAIAILNHPNIVKVLDVGFGDRLQYIVMEYIDGITLKEYLDQRKDIRWKEAVHFTVQILRALQHAHDKGIVHRDIKPQNIMLLSDGTIKVTDFGIARLTRNEVKSTVEGNKAIGSVHYISPEQARGEITDEKTDLYAVGIMLYEMLTGCLPFEADNAVSVAIMQMQSEAKAPHLINDEIPEGLEQITLKAMQKDTAKRYQSAAEMLSDFDEFKRNPSIKFEYTYMSDDTPTRYVDAITRVRGESTNTKPNKEDASSNKAPINKKNVSLTVVLLVVAALTVAAVVGLVLWILNGIRKPVELVQVDKFIGMSYLEDIKNNPDYNGIFKFSIVQEDANDPNRDVGEVFKQNPPAGDKVKKGSTITLYVNDDTPDDVKLDVRTEIEGKHKDDISRLLSEKGFRPIEVSQSSNDVPADHVIGISVELGKPYAYGTQVKIYVSSGPSTYDPIGFPPILGYDKAEAEDFLKSEGFFGTISFAYENYVGNTPVAKDQVFAISVGGVRMETLPEKLTPDSDITLIVSSGLKDATISLEWPNTSLMIDVQVNVNGRVNTELVEKFAGGINPQYTTEKLTFTLANHPVDVPYLFVVEIRENGTNNRFQMYAKLQVVPATGEVTVMELNDYIAGITPETVALPLYTLVGLGADTARSDLENLGFVVTEQTEVNNDVAEGVVLRAEYDGRAITAGEKLPKGAAIVLYVSESDNDDGGIFDFIFG